MSRPVWRIVLMTRSGETRWRPSRCSAQRCGTDLPERAERDAPDERNLRQFASGTSLWGAALRGVPREARQRAVRLFGSHDEADDDVPRVPNRHLEAVRPIGESVLD